LGEAYESTTFILFSQYSKQIVSRVEEKQRLVDANKKLIEIYQGKIKDKIGEVWGE